MENAKALIYARVSSERQKNEGHGLESQEHRCREYARQKGYEVEKAFLDSASGGGDFMKRPAMVELLEFIDKYAHKKYVVIFDDLSRLARDVGAHISLRLAFKNRGVKVECPNFNFTDSDESELVEMVLAAQNQYHRKSNRRRVIQKQRARLERGYWPFYPVPGYSMVKDPIHGKLLTPNDKAGVIREALEGFASGRFPEIADVQRFLKSKNFRDGGKVYLGKVKGLLQRVIYAGYIEYEPWGVLRRKGSHRGLISLATYEKIQERLKDGAKTLSRRDVNPEFPLRGFVLCRSCRRAFTSSKPRGRKGRYWYYYRCNNENCHEYNKGISRDVIEGRFEVLLSKKVPSSGALDLTAAIVRDVWSKREKRKGEEALGKQNRLSVVREEISSLITRISKTKDERVIRAYEDRVTILTREEQALQDMGNTGEISIDFETALNEVLGFIKEPGLTWGNGVLEDRRLVLRLIFKDKLAYDRDSGFETAEFSIPIRVSECSVVSKYRGVELGILKSRPKVFAISVYKLIPSKLEQVNFRFWWSS